MAELSQRISDEAHADAAVAGFGAGDQQLALGQLAADVGDDVFGHAGVLGAAGVEALEQPANRELAGQVLVGIAHEGDGDGVELGRDGRDLDRG